MDNRNFRRNDRGPIRQRSALAALWIKWDLSGDVGMFGPDQGDRVFYPGNRAGHPSQPTPSATQQAQAANQNNGTTRRTK
ncbi:MAG: hypothetical protein ACLT0Y_07380 [Christensenellales bacterium]